MPVLQYLLVYGGGILRNAASCQEVIYRESIAEHSTNKEFY